MDSILSKIVPATGGLPAGAATEAAQPAMDPRLVKTGVETMAQSPQGANPGTRAIEAPAPAIAGGLMREREQLRREVEGLAKSGQTVDSAKLLDLQFRMQDLSFRIELATKLVEQSMQGVKATMNQHHG